MPNTLKNNPSPTTILRSITVILLILFSTIIASTTWKFYLEKYVRHEAKDTLIRVASCVERYGTELTPLTEKLAFCAQDVLTTQTGDMFAYDLKTKNFVFDPSLDCQTEVGVKMTKESICSLFNDPVSCAEVIDLMDKGYPSHTTTRAKWLFDDAEEWVEWIIYPTTRGIGLKGSSVEIRTEQIVMALGIQTDELFAEFIMFDWIIKGIGLISLIVALFSIFMSQREYNALLQNN